MYLKDLDHKTLIMINRPILNFRKNLESIFNLTENKSRVKLSYNSEHYNQLRNNKLSLETFMSNFEKQNHIKFSDIVDLWIIYKAMWAITDFFFSRRTSDFLQIRYFIEFYSHELHALILDFDELYIETFYGLDVL